MSHTHRFLLKWARLVHVYVTLFGLLLVLFFAVTGFMLNHPDWFAFNDKHETVTTGAVPTGLTTGPDKLAIVELLRKNFGVSGELESFECHDAEEPIEVRFRSPGRESEARINRDGHTTVTHFSRGILGILTDLHRGESSGYHSGPTWSIVIDGVAVLLLTVSITGLILWSSLRNRGQHGLAIIGLGLSFCVAVYFLYVP